MSDIEIIATQDINDPFKKVQNAEARFRYASDLASLRNETADFHRF